MMNKIQEELKKLHHYSLIPVYSDFLAKLIFREIFLKIHAINHHQYDIHDEEHG
jgi:hypothetical protein